MPIRVKCRCGKTLKTPNGLAGKRVNCPACGASVDVPGQTQQTDKPSESTRRQVKGRRCKGCGKVYPLDVVICTDCGINLQTGTHVMQAVGSDSPGSRMSDRDKKVVAGAVAGGVLVLVLLYSVFSGGGAVSDNALALLPANASVLGRVRVKRLLDIPAIKEGMTEIKNEEEYQLFQKAGLTPGNIEQVYFAVDPSQTIGGSGEPEAVGLLELSAPVDKGRLVEAFRKTGVLKRETSVQGFDGVVLKAEGQGVSPLLVVLDEKRLLVGTKRMAERSAALAAGGGAGITDNSELMAVCEGGALEDIFWLALCLPEKDLRKLGNKPGAHPPIPLEEIESVLIRADYTAGTGLSFGTAMACASEGAAAKAKPEFEKMAKGMGAFFLGVAKDAVRVRQDGARVALDVRISDKVLAELGASVKDQAKLAAMPPEEKQRFRARKAVRDQISNLRDGSKMEKQWAIQFFAMNDLVERVGLSNDQKQEIATLLAKAKEDPDLRPWIDKALQKVQGSAAPTAGAGGMPAPGSPRTTPAPADTATKPDPLQEHLARLTAGGRRQREALSFFANYDEPLRKHKGAVLAGIAKIAREADGFARKRDGGLRYQAVVALRKLEPRALQAAFPTLGAYTKVAYMPTKKPAFRDGVLYLHTWEERPATLIALDTETWEEKWRYEDAPDGPVTFHKGTVFCGGGAYDPETGERKWLIDAENSGLPVFADGVVYFGLYKRYVCAVDMATGEERWRFDSGNKDAKFDYLAPALAGDTLCIIGHFPREQKIFGLDAATGEKKWTADFASSRSSLHHHQGKVYFSDRIRTYGLNAATGEKISATEEVQASLLMAGATLYGVREERIQADPRNRMVLVALDLASGSSRWESKLPGDRRYSFTRFPPVASDKMICVFLNTDLAKLPAKVFGVERTSGKPLWSTDVEPARRSAIGGGRLFVLGHAKVREFDLHTGREVVHEPPACMEGKAADEEPPQDAALEIGMRVEAKSVGRWWPANIIGKRKGLRPIQVRYDRGDHEEWVPRDKVRLSAAKPEREALNLAEHVPDAAAKLIRNAEPAFSQKHANVFSNMYAAEYKTCFNGLNDLCRMPHPSAPGVLEHYLAWTADKEAKHRAHALHCWRFAVQKKAGTGYGRDTVDEIVSMVENPATFGMAVEALRKIGWADEACIRNLMEMQKSGSHKREDFLMQSHWGDSIRKGDTTVAAAAVQNEEALVKLIRDLAVACAMQPADKIEDKEIRALAQAVRFHAFGRLKHLDKLAAKGAAAKPALPCLAAAVAVLESKHEREAIKKAMRAIVQAAGLDKSSVDKGLEWGERKTKGLQDLLAPLPSLRDVVGRKQELMK